MPNNGKIIAWDALELKVAGSASASGSGAGSPTYSYTGTATTGWTPDAYDFSGGIYLHCQSGFDGTTGTWSVKYDGPGAPFGGYIVSGSGYQATSISAVLKDILVYQKLTGALYRITWSAIDIYVNGSFNITLPGSSVDLVSDGVGPNYIPIVGVPLDLTGGGGAGRTGIGAWTYSACDPGSISPAQDYTSALTGAITGGWRFKEVGGAWQMLPVSVYNLSAPSVGGCTLGVSNSATVTAADTFSASIEIDSYASHTFTYEGRQSGTWITTVVCTPEGSGDPTETEYESVGKCVDACTGLIVPLYRDAYKSHSHNRGTSGRLRIVPDLPRAVKRHQADYRAFWLRLPLPNVKGTASRSCTTDGVTVSGSTVANVYDQSDVFIGVVGDSAHAMEDFLALPIYSPTSGGRSESDSITYTFYGPIACLCEIPDPSGCGPDETVGWHCRPVVDEIYIDSSKSESVSLSFPSFVGPEGSYQWHVVDELRYLGTWVNLHWHYLQWHEDWSSLAFLDYWGPGRQQWLYNSGLPSDERLRTRTDLIGSCCEESGHTPFLDAFVGGYRWLGCSRWQVRRPTVPTEKPTDATGGDRWTFGDFVSGSWTGTGTVGSGGATMDVGTVKATVKLLDFTTTPYLYPAICTTVRLVAPNNVDSWEAFAVGQDGASTSIATSAGTWALPAATGKKYAGSWGIDNGLGVVDDLGVDQIVGKGISAATMSDPETLVGFELLPGHGIRSIRWEVVPTNPAATVTIPHPVFIAATTAPTMVWESGQICALLFENGPLVRLGNWLFYDPAIGLVNPPEVAAAGYKSTIIDALCTIRLIWEARAYNDGLTTELTSLFDFYEGQSVSVVDKFSISYPLQTDGMPFALVNTMAEGPPLNVFPNRSWDSTTWAQTGAFKLEVRDWTQEHRYLISDGATPAHITDASGTTITTAFGSVPAGWSASRHSHPVDNLEGSTFKVIRPARVWALVSPWRGFSCLLRILEEESIGAHLFPDKIGNVYAVLVRDDRISVNRFDLNGLDSEFDVLMGVYQSAQGAASKGGHFIIAYEQDGVISVIRSTSAGEAWDGGETVAMGTNPAPAIDPVHATEYIAEWNGSEWRCIRRDDDDGTWSDVGFITSDVPEGKAGLEFRNSGGGELIFYGIDGAGARRRFVSMNAGELFEEV